MRTISLFIMTLTLSVLLSGCFGSTKNATNTNNSTFGVNVNNEPPNRSLFQPITITEQEDDMTYTFVISELTFGQAMINMSAKKKGCTSCPTLESASFSAYFDPCTNARTFHELGFNELRFENGTPGTYTRILSNGYSYWR